MNRHDSHAQRVLVSNYRRVYSRMRWLNAMAERGLQPVLRASGKVRRMARRMRDTVLGPSTLPRQPFGILGGFGGMEPLEARAMLSITPLLSVPSVSFTGTSVADDLQLRVAGGMLEFSTDSGTTFSNDLNAATGGVQSLTVSGSTAITVNLADGINKLSLDASLLTALGTTGTILYTGGSGADTIVGPVMSNQWKISTINSGTLDTVLSFSGVENLTGGAGGVDSFLFSPSGRLTGTLTGQADDKDASGRRDSVTVELQADASVHTLSFVAGDVANSGRVDRDAIPVVSFTGVSQPAGLTVVATASNDTISLQAGATVGTVDILSTDKVATFGKVTVSQTERTEVGLSMGGGDDAVVIAAAVVEAALADGDLTIDGGTGSNTMTSQAADNAWAVAKLNEGSLLSHVWFTNVQNLVGSSGKDVFSFADGATISGTVDGKEGQNTLDYSQYTTAVAVDFGTTVATGIAQGAFNYATVKAGKNTGDTLTGPTGVSLTGPTGDPVWRLTGLNKGSIGNKQDPVLSFEGFENITGKAAGRDTLLIETGGSLTGTFTGSSSGKAGLLVQSDEDDSYTVVNPTPGGGLQTATVHGTTITFTGLQPVVSPTTMADMTIFGGEVDSEWTLADGSAGQMTLTNENAYFFNVSTATKVTALSFPTPTNSLTVALGSGNTSLSLKVTTGPAIHVQGGTGINTLIARDDVDHTWTINGENLGSVDGYPAAITFQGVGRLVGGNKNDIFRYTTKTAAADFVDGGSGGSDTLDYGSMPAGVTVAIGIGNNSIDKIIGSSSVDTLYGASATNSWTLSDSNAGTVAATVRRETILYQATVVDTTADTITVFLSHGFNNGDYVEYFSDLANDQSGLTTGRSYYVTVVDDHTFKLSTALNGTPIRLTAGAWNTGTNRIVSQPTQLSSIDFQGMENLAALGGDDVFKMMPASSVTGFIDGGAGKSTLDYSAYTALVEVTLDVPSVGATTGITGGIRNFSHLIGTGASDTLRGSNADATWTITAQNSGTIDRGIFNVGGVKYLAPVTFSNFERLQGRDVAKEGFVFKDGGSISGWIDGGSDRSGALAVDDANGFRTLVKPKPADNGSGSFDTSVLKPERTFNGPSTTISFTGMEDSLTIVTDGNSLTLNTGILAGRTTITNTSNNVTLTNATATIGYFDSSTGGYVQAATATLNANTGLAIKGGGDVAVALTAQVDSLDVIATGNYSFANSLTSKKYIKVVLPSPSGNQTVNNSTGSITVPSGVILTALDGNITLESNTVTIGDNAQLIAKSTSTTGAGIPVAVTQQGTPANKWRSGKVYRDVAVTYANGSAGPGNGLRADVVIDNDGNPTVTLRPEASDNANLSFLRPAASGYSVGDMLVVKEPDAFLTGSDSTHDGSDITLRVDSVRQGGGDVYLHAYHHAKAIPWSYYNPISVAVTVGQNATITGNAITITADADNSKLFDNSPNSKNPITGGSSHDNWQSLTAPLLNFLTSVRPIVGVSLSKATADITIGKNTNVSATGGNVFIEAFANSIAQAFTFGLIVGVTYAKTEANATVTINGNLDAQSGSVTVFSTTANTQDITGLSRNFGLMSVQISVAVTEAYSHSTIVLANTSSINANKDISIKALNVKNAAIGVSGAMDRAVLGICIVVAMDEATSDVTVAGSLVAGRDTSIVAKTVSEKNSASTKMQVGQPQRPNWALGLGFAIQTGRVALDASQTSSSDTGSAAAGLAAALVGGYFAKGANADDALLGNTGSLIGNETCEKFDQLSKADRAERSFLGVGAVTFGMHTNRSTAKVSGNVRTGGAFVLRSDTLDRLTSQAQGLAAVRENRKTSKVTDANGKSSGFVLAVAMNLGFVTNRSEAVLATGAHVTAGSKVDVAANTRLLHQTMWDGFSGDSKNKGLQIPSRLLQHLGDDNLGVGSQVSTFTQSSAIGKKTGFAVSGTFLVIVSSAKAGVEEGVTIEGQQTPAAPPDVSVTAASSVATWNLVGNFPNLMDALLGQVGTISEYDGNTTTAAERKKQLGNSGDATGVGGSFSVVRYNNTTQAVVASGAIVRAHDLLVDANSKTQNVSMGIAYGKSGETSVNGVVNYVEIIDTTLAQIGQNADVVATGKVDVTANDTPVVVNIAGGVSIGTSVGFGLTVGTNVIKRDTKALIGERDVLLGDDGFAPNTGVNRYTNRIDLGYAHGFQTGDQVAYSSAGDGDGAIGGLADGGVYYARKINDTTIGLGRSPAEANQSAPTFGSAAFTGSNVLDLGYAHSFQTGDAVVYGNGGAATLGSLVAGNTYYVIRVDATRVKLASSLQDANEATALTLPLSPTGSGTNHSLRLAFNPSGANGSRYTIGRTFTPTTAVTSSYDSVNVGYPHGFQKGQAVVYTAGGDAAIGGLTNGAVYYVVPDTNSPNAFHLTASYADAMKVSPVLISLTPAGSSGTAFGFGAVVNPSSTVSSTAQTINLGYSHGFVDGQAVIYNAGNGVSIGSLTSGQTYYVTKINAQTIKLSTSLENVTAKGFISVNLTGTTGTQHSFRVAINPQTQVTGGDATSAEVINLGYAHGFTAGQKVYYSHGGGKSIRGLANKNFYYVILVDATKIRLADSLANAQAGVYLGLDATVATGTNHTIASPFRAIPAVDDVANTIRVANANAFQDGEAVVYHNGGGTSISGLVNGTTYYVTKVGNSAIKLSTSKTNLAGTVVSLNPAVATGTHHSLGSANTSTGTMSAVGVINVAAENKGTIVTVTLAAAVVSDPKSSDESGNNNAPQVPGGDQKTGQAVSGSVSVNTIDDTSEAIIRGISLTQAGGVTMSAKNSPLIVAVSGGAAISTNSKDSAKNVGLAGAVTVNLVTNRTHAFIQNATLTSVGAVTVTAAGSANIVSVAAGLGGSSRGTGIAGSVAYNTIDSDTAAYLANSSLTGTSLDVAANDGTSIITVAGSLAYGGTIGIGAGIAINRIKENIDAHVSNSALTVTGAVTVTATNAAHITAVAAGIAVVDATGSKDDPTAKGLALAVGLAINSIDATVKSYVSDDGTRLVSAGSLKVVADDADSWIVTVAGGVAVGLSKAENAGATAAAGGAAFAFNKIDSVVSAYLDKAHVTTTAVGGVVVKAHSKGRIEAYAIGGAVASASSGAGGATTALAGAGAFTFNTISKDVTASIRNGSNVTSQNSGTVTVSAQDESTIKSIAGAIAIGVGLGGGGESTVALSVGASVANNTIKDKTASGGVQAFISDSYVVAAGNLSVVANSQPTIWVVAFAGSLAFASGGTTAAAASGAGAAATNEIDTTVRAAIVNTPPQIKSLSPIQSLGGPIALTASDTATVTATAVGASLSFAKGDNNAAGLAIGVSIARNRIDDKVTAELLNADVTSKTDVGLTSTSSSTIKAVSVAASVAFAAGTSGTGVGLSGGGAEATNIILSGSNARIENSFVTAGKDVVLASSDSSSIHATVVTLAMALGRGTSVGAGVAIGAAVSTNYIGYGLDSDTPERVEVHAYVRNSTINAQGHLTITAKTEEAISAVIVAVSAAISQGTSVGIAVAGSGAAAKNKIATSVKASIDYVSNVQVVGGQAGVYEQANGSITANNVTLLAQDKSTITATAVGASLTAAFGSTAAGVAIGVSLARNEVANVISASIANANKGTGITATAGAVSLSSLESAEIKATSVAVTLSAASGSLAVSLSGAGADAYNIICNQVQSSVVDSNVNATAGDVNVVAKSTASINSLVGAVAGAFSGGANAAAGSVGVSISRNFIGYKSSDDTAGLANQVLASIERSVVTASGNVTVKASATDTVDATAFAGSVAIAIGVGGAVAAAGVGSKSMIANKIDAHVSDSTVGAVGNIEVVSTGGSTVTKSAAIGVALSASLGAVSVAASEVTNTIKDSVSATISGSSVNKVNAGGKVSVSATMDAEVTKTTVVAVSVSLGALSASGGGVGVYNTIDDTVTATISGAMTVTAGGAVSVHADEKAVVNADATVTSVAFSVGGALGVAILNNTIASTITATVDDATIASGSTSITAASVANVPTTTTVGVSASGGGAASGNRSDAIIRTRVEASATNNATLTSTGDVTIQATSNNIANSSAYGGALGTIAIGAMIANIQVGRGNATDEVVASVGTGTNVSANALHLSASGSDTLRSKSIAAGGGVLAAAGAESQVTSDNSVQATIGNNAILSLATTLDVNSQLTQNADASADSYSIALAAGSGAGVKNTFTSKADVRIGTGATVDAINILINAGNTFLKDAYKDASNLRSGSASLGNVTALTSATDIGTTLNPFQSVVDIGPAARLTAHGTRQTHGLFRIESLTNAEAYDSVRIESVSGFGVAVGVSRIDSTANAKINVTGATLENKTGDLLLATRAESRLQPSGNLLVASYAGGGAGVDAKTTANVTNAITIDNSTLKGSEVFLQSGRNRSGVPNLLSASSNAVITTVGMLPTIAVPIVTAVINERDSVSVVNSSKVQAVKNVNLLAIQGLGGNNRARTDGSVISVSLVPYGFPVPDGATVNSTNTVTVDSTSNVTAGSDSQTVMLISPMKVGQTNLLAAGKLGQTLLAVDKAALLQQGVLVPDDVAYEFARIDLDKITFPVSQNAVVHVVTGAKAGGDVGGYYQYLKNGTTDLILEQQDYANTAIWQKLTSPSAGLVAAAIESNKGLQLRAAFSTPDVFYCIKPVGVAAPVATIHNLGEQLVKQRDEILAWISSHSTNVEAVARYQVQLQQIETTLASYGLLSTSPPAVKRSLDAMFIQVPQIYVSPGSVFIEADSQAGVTQSQLHATPNASITIRNQSPFNLIVGDAVIDDATRVTVVNGKYTELTPGRVYFNNVSSSAAVAPSTKQISITQDAYSFSQYSWNGLSSPPQIDPDIYITGQVVNETGGVTINNLNGSINVSGEIRGGGNAGVTITSAKDFTLNSNNWYHSNQDPRQYVSYSTKRAAAKLQPNQPLVTASSIQAPDLQTAIDRDTSKVVAQGRIAITARYLNIDGLVQSGVDTVTLHVGNTFLGTATGSSLLDASGKPLTGISFGVDGVPVKGYFDAQRQAIVVSDIAPQGGEITIAGEVFSTGNGRLKVASGYASVDIDNQSAYGLILNRIDTTTFRKGRITIVDTVMPQVKKTEYLVTQAGIETTTYTSSMVNNQLVYSQSGAAVFTPDGTPVAYNPTAGLLYVWTEGQSFTTTTVNQYDSNSFNLLGYNDDNLAKDKQLPTSTTSVYSNGQPLLESEALVGDGKMSAGTSQLSYAVGNLYTVNYSLVDDTLVEVIKDSSLIKYVGTDTSKGTLNHAYRFIGTTAKVSLPTENYKNTTRWTDLGDSVLTSDITHDSGYKNFSSTNRSWTTGGGWMRETSYHTENTTVVGQKDYFTHTLKADNPIEIVAARGAASPTVTIHSKTDILLSGIITSPSVAAVAIKSNASFTSGQGAAILTKAASQQAGPLSFRSFVSSQSLSVGSVNIDVTGNFLSAVDAGGGAVKITAGGDIDLTAVSADNQNGLVVNSLQAGGNVTLRAPRGITAADGNSLIQGNRIELLATAGGIGSSGQSVRINSNTTGLGGLAANAQDGIFILETTDDLRLVTPTLWAAALGSVRSGSGNVRLEATSGRILDALYEQSQPLSQTEASSLNTNLQLSGSLAAEAARTAIRAEESAATQDYHNYWQTYRNAKRDAVASTIAVLDIVHVAASGQTPATDTIAFASTHGLNTGDQIFLSGAAGVTSLNDDVPYYVVKVDDTHIRLANDRVSAAIAEPPVPLSINVYGSVTGVTLIKYGYTTTSSDPTQVTTSSVSAIDAASDTIAFASSHGLNTGDQVFLSGVAGVTNLWAEQAYFVVNVDSTHIQLAASRRAALAQSPATVDITVNGSVAGVTVLFSYNTRVPTAVSAVGGNSISFASNPGLKTGDQITFSGTSGQLHNVQDNTTYFVVKIDNNRIGLAATYADAVASTPVTVSLGAAGSLSGVSVRFQLPAAMQVVADHYGNQSYNPDFVYLLSQAEINQRIADRTLNSAALTSSVSEGVFRLIYPETTIPNAFVYNPTGTESPNVVGANVSLIASGASNSIGSSSGLVNLDLTSGFKGLAPADQQLLSKATVTDIVGVSFATYRYIGVSASVNLGTANYTDTSLWQAVTATYSTSATTGSVPVATNDIVRVQLNDTFGLYKYVGAPAAMVLQGQSYANTMLWAKLDTHLHTGSGTKSMTAGTYVENRREVKSVTLQVIDDVNVEVSGAIVATAAGAIDLGSEGHINIDSVSAGGDVRLRAKGDIVDHYSIGVSAAIKAAGAFSVTSTGGGVSGTSGSLRMQVGALAADVRGNVDVQQVSGGLTVSSVTAGGNVTIKVAAGAMTVGTIDSVEIVALTATSGINSRFGGVASDKANVAAKTISLDAGSGIGAAHDFFLVGPSGNRKSVSLNADAGSGSMFIQSLGSLDVVAATASTAGVTLTVEGDAAIGVITAASSGVVTIEATQGITDLAGPGDITAGSAILKAVTKIGSTTAALHTKVSHLEAVVTTGGLWIDNTGDVEIGGVSSLVGLSATSVTLSAHSTITVNEAIDSAGPVLLTASDDIVVAAAITSNGGDVAILVDNDIAFTGTGRVDTKTGTGSVTLRADNDFSTVGKITSATTGTRDIVAANALLRAATGVGTATAPIKLSVDNLEGTSDTGGFFATNDKALTIGGIDGVALPAAIKISGVSAGQNVVVTAKGLLSIVERVASTGGDVTLRAIDASASGQNVMVKSSGAVQAVAGNVKLLAGDDLTIEAGGSVQATQAVTLRGNDVTADTTATKILIYGSVNGSSIAIDGSVATANTITIDMSTPGNQIVGPVTATGGSGSDVFNVIKLNDRANSMTLDGLGGADTYNVTFRNPALPVSGYAVDVSDSGNDAAVDILSVTASDEADQLRLGASTDPSGFASVASLATNPAIAQRVNYTKSINTLSVAAGGGSDNVVVDDNWAVTTIDGGAGRNTYSVGNLYATNSLGGTKIAGGQYLTKGVSYQTTINGGDEGDSFTVRRNLAAVTLHGGTGDDAFVVNGFADLSGLALVNAGVAVDGGGGTANTLDVKGTGFADNISITSTTVSGAGVTATYSKIQLLTVSAGDGGDTITVVSTHAGGTTVNGEAGTDTVTIESTAGLTTVNTAAGTDTVNVRAISAATTINTGNGADTVNVGSTAPTAGGNVNSISALLTVNGGSGSDTLNVVDTADTLGNTGTLTSTELTGLGMVGKIVYGTFEALKVSLGSGGDTFTVASTHAGATTLNTNGGTDTVNLLATSGVTTVNAGEGDDVVNVGNGDLDALRGAVAVTSGGGNDRVSVDDGATDNTKSVNYRVTPSSVTSTLRTGSLARAFAGLTFDGSTERLSLAGTNVANTIVVVPSQATTFDINGNLPATGTVPPRSGDKLLIDLTTVSDSFLQLSPTVPGSGLWTFGDALPVRFTSIEKFNDSTVAVVSDVGVDSTYGVKVFDAASGMLKFEVPAERLYGTTSLVGVRAVMGDLTGDGLADLIVGLNKGVPNAFVRIFDGRDGHLVTELRPYSDLRNYMGGINVAVGDVNGDGWYDLVVSPAGAVRAPIRVFSGEPGHFLEKIGPDLRPMGMSAAAEFTIVVADQNLNGPANRGLVFVGSAVNEIATVQSFTLSVNNAWVAAPGGRFQPFGTSGRGVPRMAVGESNADGVQDLIVGRPNDAYGRQRVFDGARLGTPLGNEFATISSRQNANDETAFTFDFNGDGRDETIAAYRSTIGVNSALTKFDVTGKVTGQFLTNVSSAKELTGFWLVNGRTAYITQKGQDISLTYPDGHTATGLLVGTRFINVPSEGMNGEIKGGVIAWNKGKTAWQRVVVTGTYEKGGALFHVQQQGRSLRVWSDSGDYGSGTIDANGVITPRASSGLLSGTIFDIYWASGRLGTRFESTADYTDSRGARVRMFETANGDLCFVEATGKAAYGKWIAPGMIQVKDWNGTVGVVSNGSITWNDSRKTWKKV